MPTHLTDGQLRAHLDGESAGTITDHLATCPACRSRLETIAARSAHTAAILKPLSPASDESAPLAAAALAQFKERQRKETPSMFKFVFAKRLRPLWATGAIVATLAIALTLPPVQALATNFLGLFRVQRIEVIQIDPSRLSTINGDSTLGERVGEMFSDSFKVTKESGAPEVVADAAAASAAAGFNVRLPDNGETPVITVQAGTAYEFTINRERAQAILNDAGFSDHQLPASLEGALIQVEIPAGVSAAYGPCPSPDAAEQDPEQFEWESLRNCMILAQIPSPTISAPPELNVAELASIGLQFIGMSAEEAQRLSETVDWSTTLIVPIPRNAATVTEVTVDGVEGTLLRRYADDGVPDRYTLLWVKDGIVYALSGFGTSSTAIDLANSLK